MIDNEKVYDDEISPHIVAIHEICMKNKIPFIMQFGIIEGEEEGEHDLYCTTVCFDQPGMMPMEHFKVIKRIMLTGE